MAATRRYANEHVLRGPREAALRGSPGAALRGPPSTGGPPRFPLPGPGLPARFSPGEAACLKRQLSGCSAKGRQNGRMMPP